MQELTIQERVRAIILLEKLFRLGSGFVLLVSIVGIWRAASAIGVGFTFTAETNPRDYLLVAIAMGIWLLLASVVLGFAWVLRAYARRQDWLSAEGW